jgi:hypothetical protein
MSRKHTDPPIFFRLDDADAEELDKRVAHEQAEHPGRRITRSGLAKEIVVAALRKER